MQSVIALGLVQILPKIFTGSGEYVTNEILISCQEKSMTYLVLMTFTIIHVTQVRVTAVWFKGELPNQSHDPHI